MASPSCSDLTYEPVAHVYRLSGREVPGITRVLADLGYHGKGAAFYTPLSRDRGKAVHKAVQLVDEICPKALTLDDVLEEVTLSENLHPYVEGYLLFKRDTGYLSMWQEKAVFSRSCLTAGTIDSLGSFPDGQSAIVDLKSWKSPGVRPKRGATLQVVGYRIMARESLSFAADRLLILKLSGDRKYRMYEVETPLMHEATVMAAARVWWDLQQHGLIGQTSGEEEQVAATEEDETA